MSDDATDWFRSSTSRAADWPIATLLPRKGSTRIAVVIPARNEARTVGEVVSVVAADLQGLVDELVVMDSLSDDATAAVAAAAGARVHSVADVRPDLGVHAGKGEALWKSLFVTTSEILVFIDADLTDWGPHFVPGLVGPLLADPAVELVRGFYDRVLQTDASPSLDGGRVTEIFARPWIALHRPDLVKVVQPLAGEWAIRRSTFEGLRVPMGYGVELSTLLDVQARRGLRALAQVDLGRRAHRHRDLADLGAMAAELMVVAQRRADGAPDGTIAGSRSDPGGSSALSLPRLTHERAWAERRVTTAERPSAASVSGYRLQP